MTIQEIIDKTKNGDLIWKVSCKTMDHHDVWSTSYGDIQFCATVTTPYFVVGLQWYSTTKAQAVRLLNEIAKSLTKQKW